MAYCEGEENGPNGGIKVDASWGALRLWPPMVCGSCTWNLPAGGSISEQEGDSNRLRLIEGGVTELLLCARHCHTHFIQSTSLNLHNNSMR